MAQIIQLTVDVLDALAKAKLNDLGIKADKLNQKKVTIKTDINGNIISRVTKLADGFGGLVTTSERWTKNGQKITTVTQQVGDAAGKAGKQVQSANKAFTLLGTVGLRLAHTAISRVTRSFRDAFKEMQNVDKQLTTVSRITQTSISNLDGLKEKAYEVGSAYGVMASDYLSGVAAFTRAGYREQAEGLAELSTKLQVAGEVSAETANQLLIATDKAYGFNGSVTELSSVMDKMTYVDHNYATSVEKIAEGMGIVAPVAAQAHMSVDELIASLGTITAVTQRSGSESARALRALILSILKDTTTELEDGVTMTVDEVNSVQDALKKYAPEVVAAAEATGELIDPMEAIAALSKSFEEGILTEQKLAEITSSLGGKLRASQLLSLIQNYSGMYSDMIKGMGDSLGIVDKDMERYLDSWQGKLNQLKNSFAGFTESIFDTDAVKGFIDALNYLIQAIDNPDKFADKFASAFESAVHSIAENAPRILDSINKVATMVVKSVLSSLAKEALDFIQNVLTDGIKDTFSMISENLPELAGDFFTVIGTLVAQGILNADLASIIANELVGGIIEAIPQVFVGLYNGVVSGAESWADSKSGGGWVSTINGLLGLLGIPAENYFKDAARILHWFGYTSDNHGNALKDAANDIEEAKDALEEDVVPYLPKAMDETAESAEGLTDKVKTATKSLEEYKKALEGGEKGDTFKSYAEVYKTAMEMFNKGLTGSNAYMSAIDLLIPKDVMRELHYDYEEAGKLLGSDFVKAMFEGGGDDYGANAANYIRTHLEQFEGVAVKPAEDGTFSLMATDMEAFSKSAGVTVDALWALIDALGIFDSKTTYTKEELLGLLDVTAGENGVFINIAGAIEKLFADGKSEREIKQIIGALQELAKTDPSIQLQEPEEDLDTVISKIKEVHDKAQEDSNLEIVVTSNADALFDGIWAGIKSINGTTIYIGVRYVEENSPTGGGGSGSTRSQGDTHGGGGGGKPNLHYASGTKSSVGGIALVNDGGGAELISANGKAWIAGGGEPTLTNLPQGATVFNAKQTREILTRSGIPAFDGGTGGWVSGIPVTTASGGKVNLTEEIEKILDELSKYIDKILKKAKKALDKQLEEIDKQIEALEREHDAEEDKNKLEELRLKILEAEKKLTEAENERTVRYFNKETGQWEWMADQKAVADAQKALQEAQEAYDKELAEQEYQAQIQALKDLKDALQDQYNDLADHWQEILDAIKESAEEDVDFESLLAKLGLDSNTTGSIRELIQAIQDYERKLADGTYEIPLDSATTERLLGYSGMTARGDSTLSQMYGMTSADTNAKGTSLYNMSSSSVGGDTNYYINGIKIGSDMLNMTLSQLLSVLPIYANAN